MLSDLNATDLCTTEFSGRVKVVKEGRVDPIEEEEAEMFAQAEKHLGKAKLQALGGQMKVFKLSMKKELTGIGKAA